MLLDNIVTTPEYYAFAMTGFAFYVSLVNAPGDMVQVTTISELPNSAVTIKRFLLANAPGVLFRFRKMGDSSRDKFKAAYVQALGLEAAQSSYQLNLGLNARRLREVA